MKINPVKNDGIRFPLKQAKITKNGDMIEEPNKDENKLPPKWTNATVIIIPNGNVKITKDNN